MMKRLLGAIAFGLLIGMAPGCELPENSSLVGPNADDPFSLVAGDCDFFNIDSIPGQWEKCRNSLLGVIHVNWNSFTNAPGGQDHAVDVLLKTFQYIIAHPLKAPPQNRILGAAPYSIPADVICIFDSLSYPGQCNGRIGFAQANRNVFNYIVRQVSEFRYEAGDQNFIAFYLTTPKGGVVSVSRLFFESYWHKYFPHLRAATLLHEAYHGEGQVHGRCYSETSIIETGCDGSLKGPYGASIAYLEFLLHGSSQRVNPATGTALMSSQEVLVVGFFICVTLERHFNYLPAALAGLVPKGACGTTVTYDWVMDREGLRKSGSGVSPMILGEPMDLSCGTH